MVVEELAGLLASAAERCGSYSPSLDPRGVLLASYFVLATPDEYVMHEMTYVAQDVAWDLRLLIKVFHEVGLRALNGRLSGAARDLALAQPRRFRQSWREWWREIWTRGQRPLERPIGE